MEENQHHQHHRNHQEGMEENHHPPNHQGVRVAWIGQECPLPAPPPYHALSPKYTLPQIPVDTPQSIPPGSTGPSAMKSMGEPIEPAIAKYTRCLYKLSRFMMVLCVIMLFVGVGMNVMAAHHRFVREVCPQPGYGGLVGGLGLFTAACGIYAFRNNPAIYRRQQTTAFFLLTITTVIAYGILAIRSAICALRASHDIQIMKELAENDEVANTKLQLSLCYTVTELAKVAMMEGVMALAALINMTAAMVAVSLTCGAMCNQNNTTKVTVIYIHPQSIPQIRRLAALPPTQQEQQMYFVGTAVLPSAPAYYS